VGAAGADGTRPAVGALLAGEPGRLRRQAEAALARFVTECESGTLARTNQTVAELLERWIEHLEALGRTPKTIDGYRSRNQAPQQEPPKEIRAELKAMLETDAGVPLGREDPPAHAVWRCWRPRCFRNSPLSEKPNVFPAPMLR